MNNNDFYEEYDRKRESQISKNPFVQLGLLGLVTAVLIGARKYKSRGDMNTSNYLIHVRLAAQGTLLTFLSVGLGYTIYKNIKKNYEDKK